MPALYAAITPHGYGHGAITVQVLSALAEAVPGLRLGVVGGPPEPWVRARLPVRPVLHDRAIADPGMVNSDPNTVDPEASLARYQELFQRFEAVVAEEMDRQRAFAPDLVVSNVGFVPLEAARRLGLPAVALAPFHWGQIFGAYCGAMPGGRSILERLEAIYSACDLLLATTPFVPMAEGIPARAVGPICARAAPRRAALEATLGVAEGSRLALITMGRVGGPLPVDAWPRFPGWRLIHRGPDTCAGHPDMVQGDNLPFTFPELVASVDAVVTKPGYGTVTECACAGTPLLYRSRNDWPETPHMMSWAARHVAVEEIDDAAFRSGQFHKKLQAVLQAPRPAPASPTGVAESVELLRPYLS
ncbi:hypothetical protein [Caenispirillum salinarum]|uniref:hypothetical protein n=1 Tax=Caenispirillum salinarum TaxID=859058 RepID=UPI003850DAED